MKNRTPSYSALLKNAHSAFLGHYTKLCYPNTRKFEKGDPRRDKAVKRRNAKFFETYGRETNIVQAFNQFRDEYIAEITKFNAWWNKIDAFEDFLIKNNYQCNQSKISESRYYSFNYLTYRFSGHVHPTGSMTTPGIMVDFAANPWLIDEVDF